MCPSSTRRETHRFSRTCLSQLKQDRRLLSSDQVVPANRQCFNCSWDSTITTRAISSLMARIFAAMMCASSVNHSVSSAKNPFFSMERFPRISNTIQKDSYSKISRKLLAKPMHLDSLNRTHSTQSIKMIRRTQRPRNLDPALTEKSDRREARSLVVRSRESLLQEQSLRTPTFFS